MKNEKLVYSTKDRLSTDQKEKWDLKNRPATSFSESEKKQTQSADWKKGPHAAEKVEL